MSLSLYHDLSRAAWLTGKAATSCSSDRTTRRAPVSKHHTGPQVDSHFCAYKFDQFEAGDLKRVQASDPEAITQPLNRAPCLATDFLKNHPKERTDVGST